MDKKRIDTADGATYSCRYNDKYILYGLVNDINALMVVNDSLGNKMAVVVLKTTVL